jgi:hypothetical protein
MSLLCSSTSSRLGMPAGIGAAIFCSVIAISVLLSLRWLSGRTPARGVAPHFESASVGS